MYPLRKDPCWKCCCSRKQSITIRKSHVIAAIWLIGIAISAPEYLMHNVEPFNYNGQQYVGCRSQWPNSSISDLYTVFIFSCTFAIPLSVLSYLYATIGLKLWRRQMPGNVDINRDLTMQTTRVKVIKMLFVVVILFAISWLPLQTFSMVMILYPSIRQNIVYQSMTYNIFVGTYFFFHWLSMFHSCLNPLIYCFMNDKFRSDLHDLLCNRGSKQGTTHNHYIKGASQGALMLPTAHHASISSKAGAGLPLAIRKSLSTSSSSSAVTAAAVSTSATVSRIVKKEQQQQSSSRQQQNLEDNNNGSDNNQTIKANMIAYVHCSPARSVLVRCGTSGGTSGGTGGGTSGGGASGSGRGCALSKQQTSTIIDKDQEGADAFANLEQQQQTIDGNHHQYCHQLVYEQKQDGATTCIPLLPLPLPSSQVVESIRLYQTPKVRIISEKSNKQKDRDKSHCSMDMSEKKTRIVERTTAAAAAATTTIESSNGLDFVRIVSRLPVQNNCDSQGDSSLDNSVKSSGNNFKYSLCTTPSSSSSSSSRDQKSSSLSIGNITVSIKQQQTSASDGISIVDTGYLLKVGGKIKKNKVQGEEGAAKKGDDTNNINENH